MQLYSDSTTTRSRLDDWKTIRVQLFDGLLEAVRQGEVEHNALQQQLNKWQEFFKSQSQSAKLLFELQVAKAMLWCANIAATNQGVAIRRIEKALLASCPSDAAEFIRSNQGWALDCIQRFSNKSITHRDLSIPLALCPKMSSDGKIARLILEVTSDGDGQLFQHPCDLLITYAHSDFSKAFADAWYAAKQVLKSEGNTFNFNVLWRVLDDDGNPLEEVEGRSASAGALFGFYHLLQDMHPDKEIIVLAQVDEQNIYQLKGVGKIYEKTKAIIEHGGFDSILVADEENREEVRKIFEQINRDGKRQELLPACQLITFQTLKSVRSQLVQEVMDYLDALAKRAAKLPAYYPAHLHDDEDGKTPFDDLRQMVQIIEDRSLFHERLAKERERAKTEGLNDDTKAYNPLRTRLETNDNNRESQEGKPKPPIQWDEKAGIRFNRAVILADPGFGKTWLLRYEARHIARQSLEMLGECRNDLDEIELPILVRLSDLNRSDNCIEEALIHLLANGYSDRFRRFVAGKLNTDRCVVLLDAWDEVPEEKPKTGKPIKYKKYHRQRLGQRLAEFAQRLKTVRLLMTSRIVGYGASPFADAQELEIISFDTPQIESFAQVWFGNGIALKAGFLSMLRQNQAVRGLARIPLMLALVCRVYQVGAHSFPTRRVEVYKKCLTGLLKDWKEEKDYPISNAKVKALLEMLAPVSFALFQKGYEQFCDSTLRKKIIKWLKKAPKYHELRKETPASLIDELKQNGVLISAGDYKDAPLLFLHRTFHEYLAASELARRANKEGWDKIADLIDKKAWDGEWQEVIILLTGMMDNPAPLLKMLADASKDDYFRHRLVLAGRSLAEIKPKTRLQYLDVIDKITSETILLWWSHKSNDTGAVVEHLVKSFPVLGQINRKVGNKPLLDWACEKLNKRNPYHSLTLIDEIGAAAVTPALLSRLADLLTAKHWRVRESAAYTIGDLGTIAARDQILARLADLLIDKRKEVRDSAVYAMGKLGSAAATPAFLSHLTDLLAHKEEEVRYSAGRVLSVIITDTATPASLTHLADLLISGDWDVSRSAEKAVDRLGSTATEKVLSHLADLLTNEDSHVRNRAARAVDMLGATAATDVILSRLADLLVDTNHYVCNSAIEAIDKLGSAAATPAFLSRLADLLTDGNWRMHQIAIYALSKLGTSAATEKILFLLTDVFTSGDGHTRYIAAELIGKLGTAVTPAFLTHLADLLEDEDRHVCSSAAKAVGGLGAIAATEEILSNLADLLTDEDTYGVRLSAVEALCSLGSAAATPAFLSRFANILITETGDGHYLLVRVIDELGPAATTPIFLTCLADLFTHKDGRVRSAAAETISKLGAAAVTEQIFSCLVDLLTDKYAYGEYWASEAIIKLGSAVATPAFLSRLADLLAHKEENVRSSVAKIVDNLGIAAATPAFLSHLADLLAHGDVGVRSSAATVVGNLGIAAATKMILSCLADLLIDEYWFVRMSATETIIKLGTAAKTVKILSRLAGLLTDEAWPVRKCAVYAIGELRNTATEQILSDLGDLLIDEIKEVRESAVYAIRKLGTAAAIEKILFLLTDIFTTGDEDVRHWALEAIGELGSAAATPAFLSHLADLLVHRDEDVCYLAVNAVGKLGGAAATPVFLSRLADLLKDENKRGRKLAAYAVGYIGVAAATEKILSRLADLLKDEDKRGRKAAVYAIRELGSAAATEKILLLLTDVLTSENGKVIYEDARYLAATALDNLVTTVTNPTFFTRLTNLLIGENEFARYWAADALKKIHTAQLRLMVNNTGKLQARSTADLSC